MDQNLKPFRTAQWMIVSLTLLLGILLAAPAAMAKPEFLAKIPQGTARACNTCHNQVPSLNDTGQAFKKAGFSFEGLTAASTQTPSSGQAQTAVTQPAAQTPAPEKQAPQIAFILPAQAAKGEKLPLQVQVTVGGQPAKDLNVQFFEEADMFIKDKMVLGEASTNEKGIAKINYWPAAESAAALNASIAESDKTKAAQASASLPLVPSTQAVEHAEGLKVPYVGMWVVVLLLIALFEVFAYVAIILIKIRKLGLAQQEESSGVSEEQQYASV